LTGFPVVSPETTGKQFEVMKEIMPRSRRVAVLWGGPGNPFRDRQRQFAQEAAAVLKLACTWHAAGSVAELEDALGAIAKGRSDFLVVHSTPFFFTYRKHIATFAAQARLPAVYGHSEYADDGGLITYGANIPDSYRRAAGYVVKILKGAKPADLPVELPATFELVINIKTARALSLTPPQSVLLRASRVID
jgi:putative ABC transport system substrate-binding protein